MITGTLVTSRTQRAGEPAAPLLWSSVGLERAAARRFGCSRSPAKPSNAGSRVSAISTATSDADAAADTHRGEERNADDRQARQRDHHGKPGEHHGRASRCHARAADSSGSMPPCELVAVPGHDEQRVVDADRQAQHHRQQRGGRGDVVIAGGADDQRAW